jgi:hypothetical protein
MASRKIYSLALGYVAGLRDRPARTGDGRPRPVEPVPPSSRLRPNSAPRPSPAAMISFPPSFVPSHSRRLLLPPASLHRLPAQSSTAASSMAASPASPSPLPLQRSFCPCPCCRCCCRGSQPELLQTAARSGAHSVESPPHLARCISV